MDTLFQRPDRLADPLHIVCVVFNPIRYRTRWKLFEDFAYMVSRAGQAILYTAEVAFGRREFVVTSPENPRHLQVRTSDELWIKECVLNLLVQRLPLDWRYVAWCDTDISFARGDWANETLHQLQHYAVVQMWTQARELNPAYELVDSYRSFAWCYQQGVPSGPAPWSRAKAPTGDYYYVKPTAKGEYYWHPGYCWAWRREAWDAVGGLIDWAILGGGDLYMARGLTGINRSMPKSLGVTGRRWLTQWQERADRHIHRNIGYVEGMITHYWHGPKPARAYQDRGQILVDAEFDPEKDLKRDAQGLWQLEPTSIRLRDGIRHYFRGRSEDQL